MMIWEKNYKSLTKRICISAVVDIGGSKGVGVKDSPSPGFKFFQFHAVFGKIWQNRMLAPPLEGWRPHLRETLDLPLVEKKQG